MSGFFFEITILIFFLSKFICLVKSQISCTPGSYYNGFGSCDVCPVGKYKDITGNFPCYNCPADRNSTYGFSSSYVDSIDDCFPYPDGYMWKNFPYACPNYGEVYDPVNNICVLCSNDANNKLFFVSNQVERRTNWDYSYDINNNIYYYSNSNDRKPQSIYCVPSCPTGTTQTTSSSIDICRCPQYSYPSRDAQTGEYSCKCDSNAYNSSGTCKVCDAGSILVNGVCQECPVNTYSSSGALSCTACSGNQPYAPQGSGYCYPCPGNQRDNMNVCEDCSAGQYSTGYYCYGCNQGSYSSKANFTCTPCPVGKSSSSSGSTSVDSCVVTCQAGYFSELTKNSGSYRTCSTCDAGKYSSSSGSSSCTICPSDRPYTTMNSIYPAQSADYCYSLPNGYQPISNNLFKACSGYGQVYNGSSCIKCSDTENTLFFGYKVNDFKSINSNYYYSSYDESNPVYCVPSCPFGTTPAISSSIDICTCPQYSKPSNKSGIFFCECNPNAYNLSGTCKVCDAGSILVNGVCQECPVNTYSSSGALSCTACSGNQPYAPKGSGSCYTCQGGQSSNYANGQYTCEECSAGQYSSGSYCSSCYPGSYSIKANYTCTPCPAGKGVNINGGNNYGSTSADICVDCQEGYFSEFKKDSGTYRTCSSCAIGKYSTSSGLSSCTSCPSDRPYTYPGQLYDYFTGFSYKPTSLESCFALPEGYYLENGIVSACPFGKVTYDKLKTNCISCPSGELFSPSFSPLTTSLNGINLLVYFENSVIVGTSCNKICPIGSVPGFLNGINTCKKCQIEEHKYYDKSTSSCKRCSEDSYPEYDGTLSCSTCPHPWISYVDTNGGSSTRCAPWQTGLCLCLPTGAIVSIVVIITVAFIASLALFFISSQPKFSAPIEITSRKEYWIHKFKEYESVICLVLFYIGLPFIDWLTDLSFILSNRFYNFGLFFAMLFLFCINAFLFIHVLFQKKAVPKFYILSFPEKFVEKEYDSLLKIVVTFILLIPYVIVNSPFLVVWLTIGIMFYTTKTFTIIPIQKLWMDIWVGRFRQKVFMEIEMQGKSSIDNEEEDLNASSTKAKIGNIEIDATVLNESIYYHLIIETFPLLVVQVFNNTLYNAWTPLGVFSVSFSVFNAINGLYRIAYYVWWKKYTLSCIPVELEFFPKAQVDAGQQYLFSTEYKRLEPLFKLYEEKFNQYDEKHSNQDSKNELIFSIFSKHKLYEVNSKDANKSLTMPLIEEDL